MNTARELLEFVTRQLVDHPDDVRIETVDDGGEVTFNIHVHDADIGKVIGKRGRTAKALRQVMDAAGTLEDLTCNVEIID